MSQHVLKPSELKSLLLPDGTKKYKFIKLLSGGCFPKALFEDTVSKQEVIGKIVSSPSEGDLKHWPKLRHRNLNALLDVIDIENETKIFISPFVGRPIRHVIHDHGFVNHPLCFERKKMYAKGILLGLDYMHNNSRYLLNLSDVNVQISNTSDTAVICDFSYTTSNKRVRKEQLPNKAFKAPEVLNKKSTVECLPIDMWDCGVLFYHMFTQHFSASLPLIKSVECLIKSVECLDNEIPEKANNGACLPPDAAFDLKSFLQMLLIFDPSKRISAEDAFKTEFLLFDRHYHLGCEARKFWKSYLTEKSDELEQEWNSLNSTHMSRNINFEIDGNIPSEMSLNIDSYINTDVECECEECGRMFIYKTQSDPGTNLESADVNPRSNCSAPFLQTNGLIDTVFSSQNSDYDTYSFEDTEQASCHVENSLSHLSDCTITNECLSPRESHKLSCDGVVADWYTVLKDEDDCLIRENSESRECCVKNRAEISCNSFKNQLDTNNKGKTNKMFVKEVAESACIGQLSSDSNKTRSKFSKMSFTNTLKTLSHESNYKVSNSSKNKPSKKTPKETVQSLQCESQFDQSNRYKCNSQITKLFDDELSRNTCKQSECTGKCKNMLSDEDIERYLSILAGADDYGYSEASMNAAFTYLDSEQEAEIKVNQDQSGTSEFEKLKSGLHSLVERQNASQINRTMPRNTLGDASEIIDSSEYKHSDVGIESCSSHARDCPICNRTELKPLSKSCSESFKSQRSSVNKEASYCDLCLDKKYATIKKKYKKMKGTKGCFYRWCLCCV